MIEVRAITEGKSIIRLVMAPRMYLCHFFINKEGSLNGACRCYGYDCYACEQLVGRGFVTKSVKGWLCGYVDRKTNEVHVLRFGSALYKLIQDIFYEHGDPKEYDISITLKSSQLNIINFNDRHDVVKLGNRDEIDKKIFNKKKQKELEEHIEAYIENIKEFSKTKASKEVKLAMLLA